jgi:hypothetical protein
MILIFIHRTQCLPLQPGRLLTMQQAQSQLMDRYAITDPVLSSITADKRQGLPLIAPPTAKRRRTIKKVLIEVKFFLS